MSFARVLHRLLHKFMDGQMAFLFGVRHRSAMGVRGQFVKFRRALMRVVRQDALPGCRMLRRLRTEILLCLFMVPICVNHCESVFICDAFKLR
jgi:hypothetical protein